MKMIMAIIKPFRLDDVREALTPLGVRDECAARPFTQHR